MGKKSRHDWELEINVHAWKDPAFRKKLLKDPQKAILEIGLKVPPHAKIHVHEEAQDEWHLIIHKAPPNAGQLSEHELKNIAAANKTLKKANDDCNGSGGCNSGTCI